MSRTAVVLFNLGGPDSPQAVRPFLQNLFSDPAILQVPGPVRWVLARLISRRRNKAAQAIYAHLGGRSPLLPNTEAQATALQAALQAPGEEVRCFIAMRYWHPFTEQAVAAVKAFAPDRIVLLPLYPQFSTTTTGSSVAAWTAAAAQAGLQVPTHTLCCYPTEPGFIAAMAGLVRPAYDAAAAHGTPRVLFSAHGLPKTVVERGDPYQHQCERTAAALAAALQIPGLDWLNSYQSRVGPLEWIGPATDAEIERAGRDGVPVVVVPIAFVSEHSETLVELGIEYRHLAQQCGVPYFAVVPTVGNDPAFINGLAGLVRASLQCPGLCSQDGGRLCPAGFSGCPQR